MGLTEQQFDDCTPRYFVLRLNGLRAAQKRDKTFVMTLVREICFYAGNGGNFKHGVKKRDIFALPNEEVDELKKSKELAKILETAVFMNNWTGSEKWKPPHD